MILISQPRAGSDWFLQGLTAPWAGMELLSRTGILPGNPYAALSPAAKVSMLVNYPPEKTQKIIAWDVTQQAEHGVLPHKDVQRLIRGLKKRSDLYLLERRNIRAMIISFILAAHNMNFHGTSPLAKEITVTYKEFFKLYRGLCGDFNLFSSAFEYRERFVYEDLVSGAQVPTTLDWNPSRAQLKRRFSLRSGHKILNLDELISWMDDLNVPGDLTEGL